MKTYKELYEFGKSKVADYSPQQRTLANDIFLCVAKEALTEHDQEIRDMIDAEIELYEGIIKSTEDKPTKMAFEGSVLALNKIRSKL